MEQLKTNARCSQSDGGRIYSCIANFEIIKKIGEGSYSSVFKVKRLANNHIYALKQIRIKHLGKKDLDSALNEVRLLASLKHHNIIAYKQTFYEKGSLYLVLQYADMGDLANMIEEKKEKSENFEEIEIWRVLLQMAEALLVLHRSNIIHRDVKPANIFLFSGGQAKLGDLNVSKIYGDQLCLTQTGTPYYASPEIWSQKPYDKKCDIWSLGCSIYEMATFQPPFLGQDMEEIYQNITKQPFTSLPQRYSRDLNRLIGKMLQKDPKKRISAQSIILNVSKVLSKMTRQPLAAKTLNLTLKRHRREVSQQLLKTIVFPRGKNKKQQRRRVNEYLPTSVYSREKSQSSGKFEEKSVLVRNSVNVVETGKVGIGLRGGSEYMSCVTDKGEEVSIYGRVRVQGRRIEDDKFMLPAIKRR